jgi:hypothetical protein
VTRQWLAAAFAIAMAAIVYVPIAQPALEREPDLSFRVTTHDAFARRVQLGRDLVSTYGPWGILQHGYDPRTDRAVLVASAFLAIAFGWGVFRLARDAKATPLAIAALVLSAVALTATGGLDGRFTVLIVLAALSMLEPWSAARELPLVAILGMVALIKFTLLVFAVLVVVGVAVARRRFVHVVVFVAGLLGCWVVGGQRVAGLPGFLGAAWEVARGYGAASSSMGLGVPLALRDVASCACERQPGSQLGTRNSQRFVESLPHATSSAGVSARRSGVGCRSEDRRLEVHRSRRQVPRLDRPRRLGVGESEDAHPARRLRLRARLPRVQGRLPAAARHRLLLLRQLGAGKADHPDDVSLWTVDRFRGEVEQVRKALGLDHFILYGHSWGGMLGIEYALAHQDHLQALSELIKNYRR